MHYVFNILPWAKAAQHVQVLVVAHADIVEVHGVPKLEHWTPL